jgi:hypothetical protein
LLQMLPARGLLSAAAASGECRPLLLWTAQKGLGWRGAALPLLGELSSGLLEVRILAEQRGLERDEPVAHGLLDSFRRQNLAGRSRPVLGEGQHREYDEPAVQRDRHGACPGSGCGWVWC